ncbi:hypothetical protein AOQ84DRAFT_118277 [Glonium stellatum]|uniref:Cleavage/polyadenylation specificity factor A subunit N-terminal domain-containing protein n=1 Tax=Glonium stellatum TaxID=574774 RepID=A0A8E2FAV9_9PEZI|nr:hypothetical protein AOQ84DRAFT_118277 [Glonium stellatum]
MSIQTGVLVNGEWTTRSVDIHQILARNRQQSDAKKKEPEINMPEEKIVLGVLSRTVLRSPMIDWIIPARVRDKNKNDVVFIGEDFVHIKEIRADGHLNHVATKADFGCRIRAARVFGEPRKPMLDSRVKVEEADIAMDLDSPDVIPPQVLVLSLESRLIMFLFAEQCQSGKVTFSHTTVPLPAGTSFLEQPGKHLAVDPKSRAIAIAACEGTFILYCTKSMAKWREESASQLRHPIIDEQARKVDGVILKMEFLSSALSDDHHVILLVIFSKEGRTRMSCYDWDSSKGLGSVTIRAEGHPLEKDERTPLFVIPLQQSPGFLLVAEQGISLYQDILSGSSKRDVVSINEEYPRYPGSSKRKPLWTHWARMARNWEAQGKLDENFYIIREDGIVHYVQVNPETHATTTSAGQFGCTVDSAFASLDVGRNFFSLRNPDVLIAAGDMSYGELIKIGAWENDPRKRSRAETMELEYLESLPNWAPITDTLISRLPGVQTGYDRQREALFATTGRSPYGAISELRWGLNALVGATIDSPDFSGVTAMWTLYDTTHDGTFFLLSFPLGSYLFHLSIPSLEITDDFGEQCGIQLGEETLTAGSVGSYWAVQVTHKAIYLLNSSSAEGVLLRDDTVEFPPGTTALAAAVHFQYPLVVTAVRHDTEIRLELGQIVDHEGKISLEQKATHSLPADPTCLSIVEIDGMPHAFVGTTNAFLLLFRIDVRGLTLVMEERVDDDARRGSPIVCENVALLTSKSSGDVHMLVCGMRDGSLYNFELRSQAGETPEPLISLGFKHVTNMGNTSARVIQSDAEASTAFVVCGSDLCHLNFRGDQNLDLQIESVWFTDRNQPGYQQSAISAFALIPSEGYSDSEFASYLIAISGSKLLVAQLDDEVKAVPRRLTLRYTPYRLMYSERLRMMVVATTKIKERSPRARSRMGRRTVRSVVQLIRLEEKYSGGLEQAEEDEGTIDGNIHDKLIAGECVLWPRERVYALLDWTYDDGTGKKYGFLIVGTGYPDGDNQKGRMLFLRTHVEGNGKVSFYPAKIRDLDRPVYAISTYKENRLVFTSGDSLHIDEFSVEDKRLVPVCKQKLTSAGIQITTSPPLIYVSTSQDSVLAFELKSTPSGHTFLDTLFSDGGSRASLHHLVVPISLAEVRAGKRPHQDISPKSTPKSPTSTKNRTLVLISDKSSSLTGLIQPVSRTLRSAAPTVFEASLPRSVTRLRRGAIRPPWRSIYSPSTNASVTARNGYSPLPNGKSSISSKLASSQSVPGVLVDDIIGTATDGTLFAFSVLDEPAWRFLKFLENLLHAKESFKTSPDFRVENGGKGSITRRDVDPEPDPRGYGQATAYHISGDALASLLEGHGSQKGSLLRLVTENTDDEVLEMFRELFHDILPQATRSNGFTDEEEANEHMASCVMQWLRGVLQSIL